MSFQDRILRRLKKSNDFRYLSDLVNSGKKEVKLNSDITLDSYEESLFKEGINIETDGLVIDGNGYIIDARGKTRIFKFEGKNVTFKNITFKDGTASPKDGDFESIFGGLEGGAVYAVESKIDFIDCTFEDNSAFRGGAIFSCFSQIHVENCRFIGNYGYEFAGAIFNDELSSMTIVNSEFWGNVSFDDTHDIMSVESSLKIIGCKFTSLSAKGTSILARSYGNLVLKDSTFNKSNVTAQNMSVVKGCDFIDSTLDTARGVLYCNEKEKDNIPFIGGNIHYLENNMDWVRELTQHEFAAEFLKFFSESENGELSYPYRHDDMVEFVEIWREIWPHESNFLIADAIANVYTLDADDIQNNYLANISREGATDKKSFDKLYAILDDVLESVTFSAVNFKYMDDLIHKENNIQLKFDVCLDDGEIEDYADGIKIDVDNLVIDGKGHVIDAKNNASIFKIDAKNVLIKNLAFKNAFSNMGGAISNIGDVKFENCIFQGNVASELGGAIVNDEKMLIDNCEFEGNFSGGVGGAIAATHVSDLGIKDSKFKSNAASLEIDCPGDILPDDAQGFGGAIYNNGKLDINGSVFLDNRSDRSGAAMIVLPDSKINMNGTLFKGNHAKLDGGAIHTMGEININNSEFISNRADNNAGVFDATESSKLNISNSKFEDNSAENGNVIFNRGELELFESFVGSGDIVDERNDNEVQNTLPDVNDDWDEIKNGSDDEFPEDYDDFAKRFKESFETAIKEDDSKPYAISCSLILLLWGDEFPEDANMIAASLILANIYDDELVEAILEDFSQEEYKKKLDEYDPIDNELYSWFRAIAMLSMALNFEENESGQN